MYWQWLYFAYKGGEGGLKVLVLSVSNLWMPPKQEIINFKLFLASKFYVYVDVNRLTPMVKQETLHTIISIKKKWVRL